MKNFLLSYFNNNRVTHTTSYYRKRKKSTHFHNIFKSLHEFLGTFFLRYLEIELSILSRPYVLLEGNKQFQLYKLALTQFADLFCITTYRLFSLFFRTLFFRSFTRIKNIFYVFFGNRLSNYSTSLSIHCCF